MYIAIESWFTSAFYGLIEEIINFFYRKIVTGRDKITVNIRLNENYKISFFLLNVSSFPQNNLEVISRVPVMRR